MMLRLTIALSGALMASGLAGCNNGGDDDTGSTGATEETGAESSTGEPVAEVGFDDFYAAAEQAFCEWQVACRQYGVTERCQTVIHMESRLSMQQLSGVGSADAVPIDYMKEAIKVGRIGFDEEKAATCLAFVGKRSCDIPYLHPWTEEELAGQAACAGVFTGRMGRNGPCLSAAECAETSVCGFDPNCVDACCVGACRVLAQPLALGEACGNAPCAVDSYCANDPNTSMPTVCTASPTVGQQCDGACTAGSFCDYTGDTPVCRVPKAEGAICYGDHECERPGICRYNDIDYTGKCFRPRDEGEACDFDSDYGPQCLRFDNACDLGGLVCGPLPSKGESCPDYACQGDYFCSEAQGERCVPVADAGEPCGYSPANYDFVPCSGDNFCDFEAESGVCQEPSGAAGCAVPADPGQG